MSFFVGGHAILAFATLSNLLSLPPLRLSFATSSIDASPYDPKVLHHPMQFSFQDAFECTIDGINKAIMWENLGYASYSDNLPVIHTPVISAISHLESEIRINGLVNWYEIIWFTLQQEGIVEDYTITDRITNFYP